MNREKSKPKLITFLPISWLILILGGCTLFSVPQSLIPTRQAIPSENTATPIPLDTPTITFTPQPHITPTSLVTQTPTYNWLLPSNPKSIATVSPIMDNNGGCQLPCWWGITPGKTSWVNAKSFLSQFNVMFSEGDDTGNEFNKIIYISTSDNASRGNGFLTVDMNISNGIVERINTDYFNPKTDLSQFLIHYGQPDQIFVNSLASNMGGPPPFDLFLFYPRTGILAYFFEGENDSEYKNNIIHACVSRGPELSLWFPERIFSIQEVGKMFPKNAIADLTTANWNNPLLTIKEATGMSIDQFYQLYKNPSYKPCFQTPIKLWQNAEDLGPKPSLTP